MKTTTRFSSLIILFAFFAVIGCGQSSNPLAITNDSDGNFDEEPVEDTFQSESYVKVHLENDEILSGVVTIKVTASQNAEMLRLYLNENQIAWAPGSSLEFKAILSMFYEAGEYQVSAKAQDGDGNEWTSEEIRVFLQE